MNTSDLVFNKMYSTDKFSQWLNIEKIITNEGHCILKMQVRSDMMNGHNVAHGGISYALADSAFAFACNSYDQLSLSIETSITHTNAIRENDILIAEAKMITQSKKIGTYEVIVKNQEDNIVAVFKGVCYRTSKNVI